MWFKAESSGEDCACCADSHDEIGIRVDYIGDCEHEEVLGA